ncbi:hypothetical protein BJ742DRAFT_853784 [Cladochytrium replicatum]|nr:hypothetical protein BJ742DRAFT_853784 [Cladochytrium replicatum]
MDQESSLASLARNPNSFREMVARKRAEVKAAALIAPSPSSQSGRPSMAKSKSTGSVRAIGNSTSTKQPGPTATSSQDIALHSGRNSYVNRGRGRPEMTVGGRKDSFRSMPNLDDDAQSWPRKRSATALAQPPPPIAPIPSSTTGRAQSARGARRSIDLVFSAERPPVAVVGSGVGDQKLLKTKPLVVPRVGMPSVVARESGAGRSKEAEEVHGLWSEGAGFGFQMGSGKVDSTTIGSIERKLRGYAAAGASSDPEEGGQNLDPPEKAEKRVAEHRRQGSESSSKSQLITFPPPIRPKEKGRENQGSNPETNSARLTEAKMNDDLKEARESITEISRSNSQRTEYPVTPFQLEVYLKIVPQEDDSKSSEEIPPPTPSCDLSIVQIFSIRVPETSLNPMQTSEVLGYVLDHVVSAHAVLCTRFFRNDKILDADLQALIVPSHVWDSRATETVPVVGGETLSTVQTYVMRVWLPRMRGLATPGLRFLLFPMWEVCVRNAEGWIAVSGSTAVADELTCAYIICEAMQLFHCCVKSVAGTIGSMQRQGRFGHDSVRRATIGFLESYEFARRAKRDGGGGAGGTRGWDSQGNLFGDSEGGGFPEFADEVERIWSSSQKRGQVLRFWRDVCIEVVQEATEEMDPLEIETQLKKLATDRDTLQGQIASLGKRKGDLEAELTEMRQERMQIDVQEGSMLGLQVGPNGSSNTKAGMTYFDPEASETIQISEVVKNFVLRTVIGDEAVHRSSEVLNGQDGDATSLVVMLLDKHEVPKSVQDKIEAQRMSLEDFAELTEDQIADCGLLTRDKRKIMALSDYLRNRIKESIQEQSKVKFTLERKILKGQRELDASTTNLRAANIALEANDETTIKLKRIINPPKVEVRVPALTLESSSRRNSVTSDGSHQESTDGDQYGFIPISINGEILLNLRQFHEGTTTTMKLKKEKLRSASRARHLRAESTGSSSADESDGGGSGSMFQRRSVGSQEKLTPIDLSLLSPNAVCLAAFAVLLKHISGIDKFLIGVVQSFRRRGLLSGPLTDVLPVKIDLVGPSTGGFNSDSNGLTFEALFEGLRQGLREARRNGPACPSSLLSRKFNLESRYPVQYEYWTRKDISMLSESWAEENDSIQWAADHEHRAPALETNTGGHRMEPHEDLRDLYPKFVRQLLLSTKDQFLGHRLSVEEISAAQRAQTSSPDLVSHEPRPATLIGSHKTSAASRFDLKLVVLEEPDNAGPQSSLIGGFVYDKSKFDEAKVTKWAEKFLATLASVEYGTRKIKIKHLISRYYSAVWNIGSVTNLASAGSQASLQSENSESLILE